MVRIGKDIEEIVEKYYPVARKLSKGDEDLQQELILWVIEHLVCKNDVNEKYIIQRMRLQVRAYQRGYLMMNGYGKSIDRGDATGRKHAYSIVDCDFKEYYQKDLIEADLKALHIRCSNPDKEALFQVDYEKFIGSLTDQEKTYLQAKMNGYTWKELKQDLFPAWKQQVLKTRIKEKMKAYFMEW